MVQGGNATKVDKRGASLRSVDWMETTSLPLLPSRSYHRARTLTNGSHHSLANESIREASPRHYVLHPATMANGSSEWPRHSTLCVCDISVIRCRSPLTHSSRLDCHARDTLVGRSLYVMMVLVFFAVVCGTVVCVCDCWNEND